MRMDKTDLEGKSLADILELLEKGRIGHDLAMAWLAIDSLIELTEIMHHNGRSMPGHRPMPIRQATLDLLTGVSSAPVLEAAR